MVDAPPPPIDLAAKIAQIKAEKAAAAPPPVQQPPSNEQQWDQSVLLPDLGLNLTDADKALDEFVGKIDIVSAYNKWCRKMTPDVGSKREGIMISCPNPAHPDKDPSAWINLDKQTYFCGGCQEGGDIHDIAAYAMGYPVPGYKEGETFHELRERMAESFGFRTKNVSGGKVAWIETPPESAQPSSPGLHVVPDPSAPVPDMGSGSTEEDAREVEATAADADGVAHMWADDEEPELVIYPTINWRSMIPEDTFVYEYMNACCNDDAPEEYHFWHALMGLGLVVGRNVTLDDTRPVYGNLMLCTLGGTGTGKSRSRGWLDHCLRETAPYKEDGSRTTGVKLVPVPSSGEYLVNEFYYEGKDPTNGKTSLGPQRVVGLVDFDEMSALLTRANRQGSSLKPTLMQFADATKEVSIGSLMRGDFIAREPFCSITASTQPKAIRNLLNRHDTSSGFLNRWIFAGGKTKQIEVLGGTRTGITVNLERAIEELKKVRGWGAVERSIEFEDEAYEAFEKFFRAKIEPAKIKDDTDLLKRIDLICKKIMLLLTINERKQKVTLPIVRAMMELFEYVLECYGILNSNIGVTMMQDVMNEIQRHIVRHKQKTGRGASARDIQKYTKRKNYSLEQIKKALDVMNALDIIELAPREGTMGRPTVRYQAVGE